MCVLICAFNVLTLPKVFIQNLQENFLIFKCWISIWSFKCPFVLYVLLQWGHSKGLWRTCRIPHKRKAFSLSIIIVKIFIHECECGLEDVTQGNRTCYSWDIWRDGGSHGWWIWLRRLPEVEKILPHSEQKLAFSESMTSSFL